MKKAIENNIEIHPIPGACAFVNALICSGLNTKRIYFCWFFISKQKDKIKKLEELKEENKTLIFMKHHIK